MSNLPNFMKPKMSRSRVERYWTRLRIFSNKSCLWSCGFRKVNTPWIFSNLPWYLHSIERNHRICTLEKKMSFEFGYALDKGEDKRGVTIDFNFRSFLFHRRNLTFIDTPGHGKFIPAVLLSDFVIYVFNVKLNLTFGQIHLSRKLKKYQYLAEM